MARVTVEDCIDKVENRFELVLLASHRARMISSGSQITVERDNDKNPVVSLREIAETTVSPGDLKEDLIHSLQKYVEVDEPEPEVPLIGAGAGAGVDSDDTEVTADRRKRIWNRLLPAFSVNSPLTARHSAGPLAFWRPRSPALAAAAKQSDI